MTFNLFHFIRLARPNWFRCGIVPLCVFLLSVSAFASHPDRLAILVEKWPGDVHPIDTVTLEGVLISNQVFETLVSMGPGGEISPRLLESWRYAPEQLRFYFKLKQGVHFSNGQELNTRHIINMFSRILKARRFRNFERIRGAKAFIQGINSSVSGIKAISDSEFSIAFDVALPRVLEDLADPYAVVFLESGKNPYPLGTGAYKLAKVDEKNKTVLLDRNPFHPVPVGSFEELLFTSNPSTPNIEFSFLDNSPAQLHLSEQHSYFDTEVYLLAFNSAHPLLRDSNTRKRLASYLTPEMVAQAIGQVPYPVGGYIPLGMPGHNPNLKVPPAPKNQPVMPEKLTLLNYFPRLKKLSEDYCNALSKGGIPCEAKQITFDEMFSRKKDNSLQLFIFRQKSTNYTVEYLLSCFAYDSIFNLFLPVSLQDPLTAKLENLFQATLNISNSDKEALIKKYREIDRTVIESALVKPFRYGATRSIWLSPRIELPSIDTLGPFGIKFYQVKLRGKL